MQELKIIRRELNEIKDNAPPHSHGEYCTLCTADVALSSLDQYEARQRELPNEAYGIFTALHLLVKLKEHKDEHGADQFYRRTKPIVWEGARKALSEYKEAK